jgi:hypothetical protein
MADIAVERNTFSASVITAGRVDKLLGAANTGEGERQASQGLGMP